MLPGFHDPEDGMNVGKTLFTQVMEFVPWKAFSRIVVKHRGDNGIRTLSCADLFRVLAFSQLTWRESLRDIEACLAANQIKLFHMGLAQPPARSTLANRCAGDVVTSLLQPSEAQQLARACFINTV